MSLPASSEGLIFLGSVNVPGPALLELAVGYQRSVCESFLARRARGGRPALMQAGLSAVAKTEAWAIATNRAGRLRTRAAHQLARSGQRLRRGLVRGCRGRRAFSGRGPGTGRFPRSTSTFATRRTRDIGLARIREHPSNLFLSGSTVSLARRFEVDAAPAELRGHRSARVSMLREDGIVCDAPGVAPHLSARARIADRRTEPL